MIKIPVVSDKEDLENTLGFLVLTSEEEQSIQSLLNFALPAGRICFSKVFRNRTHILPLFKLLLVPPLPSCLYFLVKGEILNFLHLLVQQKCAKT